MALKVLGSFLAVLMITTAAHAQTATPQTGSAATQAIPNAAMMASVPNVDKVLSSFLATVNRPTTVEKTEVHIQRAQAAYNDKKYKDAMTSLQLAQDALRRQHADYYTNIFPKASKNWSLEETKPEDMICLGQQIFGGMLVLSRTYSSNGNKVQISLMTDAPVLSFVGPILQAIAPFIAKGEIAQGTIKEYPSIYVDNINGGAMAKRPSRQDGSIEFSSAKQTPMHVLIVLVGDVIVGISSETLDREYLSQFANILDYDKLKRGQ